MVFKAKLKADVLRNVIAATSTLVDEAKFHLTPSGLTLKAVDPAHVAMVDLTLSSKAFEEYKATEMEIGVELEKLKDVLKLAGSGDSVKFEYQEDAHRLVITIGNLVRRMSLVDTQGMSDPKVPNLNLPNKVTLKADELLTGIRASEGVSDHVALVADPEFFQLLAEGDNDSVDLRLAKDQMVELVAKERSKSLFSLDYFSNMIKAVGSGDALTMSLGSDFPVRMEFDIADGHGHVTYLLAPRIESE